MQHTGRTTMIIRITGWWKGLAVVAAIGVIWILPAVSLPQAVPGLPSGAALSALVVLGLLATALIAGHRPAQIMAPAGTIVSGALRGHA